VLIIQNETGNKYSPTVIAAAVTTQITKAVLPTHIELPGNCSGMAKDSVALLEQIRTLDKRRLRRKVGRLKPELMNKVDQALHISFGLT
jgi:mRNA interferase MazF